MLSNASPRLNQVRVSFSKQLTLVNACYGEVDRSTFELLSLLFGLHRPTRRIALIHRHLRSSNQHLDIVFENNNIITIYMI